MTLPARENLPRVLVGIAVVLAFASLLDTHFWMDEIISISVAAEGPLYSIPATLRFSAHPPAYYWQLSLWMLISDSDFWIALNGVAWFCLAIFSAYYFVGRLFGRESGLWTAALLAISPQMLFFADNVRMYAFSITFILAAWYLTQRYFDDSHARWSRLLGRALCLLVIGYAHGIGIIVAASMGFFAAVRALAYGWNTRHAARWFLVEISTGILLLPALVNGLFRETQHTVLDFNGMVEALLVNLLGPQQAELPLILSVTLLGMALAVCLLVIRREAIRSSIAVLVFGYCLFLLLITLLVQPILSARALFLALPFMALAGGYIVATSNHSLAVPTALAWFAIMFLIDVSYLASYEKPNRYDELAMHIGEVGQDDTIIMTAGTAFWGASRAIAGPGWGSALDIQPEPNIRWHALYDKLGKRLTDALRLRGSSDRFYWHDATFITVNDCRESAGMKDSPATPSVWFVYNRAVSPDCHYQTLLALGYRKVSDDSFVGTALSHFIK